MDLNARQIIIRQPTDLRGKKGAGCLDDLFKNFCEYAKSHYDYSATKIVGSEGATILQKLQTARLTVDCASLADAFIIMAKEDLGVADATRGKVEMPLGSFATKANSQCFDPQIVGNMRMPRGSFAQTARCVFASHWFAKAAGRLFDPCLLTTYGSEAEVMAWKFQQASGKYNGKVCLIERDPAKFVIALPDNSGVLPKGFRRAWIICEVKQWDKAQYKAAFKKEKPGWQMSTHSINQLLKSAGYPQGYPDL